jgi:chromate transporter
MNSSSWSLLSVFSLLSILAVGGGTAVLPEMHKLTVTDHHWITDDQFRDIYSLGQIAPGPNMLMIVVIGYHVDGYTGAAIAFGAFFFPCCLLTFVTARIWDYFRHSPWRLSVQHGMAPIVIGLMTGGVISIARTSLINWTTVFLALLVFVVLYFGKKINPALLILAGGVLGFIFLR